MLRNRREFTIELYLVHLFYHEILVPKGGLGIILYSWIFHKRPPKMQTFNGHLREMVAYKNRTTGGIE